MRSPNWESVIQRHLDGLASGDEMVALSQQLETDEDLRRLYLHMAHVHAALASEEMDDFLRGDELKYKITSIQGTRHASRQSQHSASQSSEKRALSKLKTLSIRYWLRAMGGIAALFLFGFLLNSLFLNNQRSSATHVSATLGYANGATWDDQELTVEQDLINGTYALTEGMIRLTMVDGTVVTMQGPTHFELLDRETIILKSGRLSARVSDPDSRFTVLTDQLHVLDLGTAFGVNVDDSGQTLVSVFEGEVQVSPRHAQPDPEETIIVQRGGVVTANPDSTTMLETVDSDRGLFNAMWPLTTGVEDLTHLISYLPPVPSKPLREYQDDDRIFMMPERQGVVLPKRLKMNVTPNGEGKQKTAILNPGTKVDSYILFYNKSTEVEDIGKQHTLSGQINFAKPILGIISSKFSQSDRILGIDGLDYAWFIDRVPRGLEHYLTYTSDIPIERDHIWISEDCRQLHFQLNLGGQVDQFRVIVAAE